MIRHGTLGGMSRVVLSFLVLLLSAGAAGAEISAKRPPVIDAVTLGFPGQPVRLYGLQGLDPRQHCQLGAETWPCGSEARSEVIFRINFNWVVCLEQGVDPGGVLTAICYLGGVGGPELNAWVVERGWAMARPEESDRYLEAERRARQARKGIWRGVEP